MDRDHDIVALVTAFQAGELLQMELCVRRPMNVEFQVEATGCHFTVDFLTFRDKACGLGNLRIGGHQLAMFYHQFSVLLDGFENVGLTPWH